MSRAIYYHINEREREREIQRELDVMMKDTLREDSWRINKSDIQNRTWQRRQNGNLRHTYTETKLERRVET